MSEIITLNQESESIKFLMKRDKRIAKVIQLVGEITYTPSGDPYAFLVNTIIGQMLSNKVADIMSVRLESLCNGHITPEAVTSLSDEKIRSIGISTSKVKYIRNLTDEVVSGRLNFDYLDQQSDKDIIKTLTGIRGIGGWTAKMYLIFVLNRQDILPYEDMAFLQGFSWLYKTTDFSPKFVSEKCAKWKPYTSIAVRYLYRALDTGLTKEGFRL